MSPSQIESPTSLYQQQCLQGNDILLAESLCRIALLEAEQADWTVYPPSTADLKFQSWMFPVLLRILGNGCQKNASFLPGQSLSVAQGLARWGNCVLGQ